MLLCANECTLAIAPERVRNVPKIVMKNVMLMSATFHTLEEAASLLNHYGVDDRRWR